LSLCLLTVKGSFVSVYIYCSSGYLVLKLVKRVKLDYCRSSVGHYRSPGYEHGTKEPRGCGPPTLHHLLSEPGKILQIVAIVRATTTRAVCNRPPSRDSTTSYRLSIVTTFCSRTHRLATIHNVTLQTDNRRQTTDATLYFFTMSCLELCSVNFY